MVKVLIIDDSAFMRKKITEILNKDNDLDVVGSARDGAEGLLMIEQLKPDVITLDINMPKMDGLTCLAIISEKFKIPVVMLSSLTQEGELATFEALELGAVDFIAKPGGTISRNLDLIEEEIRFKVKAASMAKGNDRKVTGQKQRPQRKPKIIKPRHIVESFSEENFPVVVIGLSTGGPRTIFEVLPQFQRDINFAVVVVQHIPQGFSESLADRISKECNFDFKLAGNRDIIEPGKGYLAPGGLHLTMNGLKGARPNSISLSRYPSDTSFIPSVDVTFTSFAKHFGKRCIGVVMTGMGVDGTQGASCIKEVGGTTIAEHEDTCVVYGMPKSLVDSNLADYICPSYEIAEKILDLTSYSEVRKYG